MPRRFRLIGFSLAEMLIVVAVIGVLAISALPNSASYDKHKVDFVTQEVVTALRLAVSEARRRQGSFILIDGKAQPGALRFYVSDSQARIPPFSLTSELPDPVSKRPAVINPASTTLSSGVVITPRFIGSGQPWGQLLIGPSPNVFTAFDGAGSGNSKGSLQTGSEVLVTLGTQSASVYFDPATGYVARQ